MATSPSAVFSGQSSYSADFQQVLTRAVGIASLPLQAMQSDVSKLQAEQQALSGLQSQFTGIQNAIQAVSAAVNGSFTSVSSQPQSVAASITSGALAGTYKIQVDDPGSSSTSLSRANLITVSDPSANDISSSLQFTLTVNGTAQTISPTNGTLTSLADAINASGAGVRATIVNVGPNSNPDYRLSVTSNNLGADTIQLNDGTNDLLDNLTTGTPAKYEVNGSSTQLQSNSTEVTLAPGLTVRLLQPTTTGQPATITVASDYSSLKSTLSGLATAYNSAVDAVGQQRGSSAGPLAGQSIVYALGGILQQFSQYTGGSGSVGSLTALGLSLDQSGHLSFDPTVFTGNNIAAVQQFLGSTSSGGFLKAATDTINSASDATSGIIQTDVNGLTAHITNLNDRITQIQTRVDDITTNLQAQLSAADAAIATLQAQKSYFTNLFAATYLNNNNGTTSGG
jgi:flagellar hook-associated protein 2